MSDDPAVEEWIDRARSASILEVATQLGARLKRSGSDWVGPCPGCGGDDRFVISPHKEPHRQFLCRHANEGGDVINMVEHVHGVPFMAACEIINGCPAPDRQSTIKPVDPEVERAKQEARRQKEAARQAEEAAKSARQATSAAKLFDSCRPIAGTHADAYLKARGIFLSAHMADDLRFHEALDYRGWAVPAAEEETVLGKWPCIVAAIRNVAGEIIGVHRTYLDRVAPAKFISRHSLGFEKAKAQFRDIEGVDCDPDRNAAKKVYGRVMGGAIRLGPITRCMAAGEGIETTLSWYQIGMGPDDVGVICAVTRGNLCGGSTDTIKHPNGRGTIPNGTPSPDKPGMVLPPEVDELILLGDRDPDMVMMNAFLLTGARRHRAAGRTVTIHTPELLPGEFKTDWNDHLLASVRRAA